MKTDILLRYGERCLLLVGLLLFGVAAIRLVSYQLFQRTAASVISETKRVKTLAHSGTPVESSRAGPLNANGLKVTGKLEIPRLSLSVMVVDGDEEQGLRVAAVHLAGTAPVGGSGNAVVAGHRDTSFWPLRNVRIGDVIRFRGAKMSKYSVVSVTVVSPEDTSVLAADKAPVLTLITCYPFRFVGSAPSRLVVRARLVS